MTDEEKRIAIAKECGITVIRGNPRAGGIPRKGCHVYQLPDYLNDLNAMHEGILSQPRNFRLKLEAMLDNYCAGSDKLWVELTAREIADHFLQCERGRLSESARKAWKACDRGDWMLWALREFDLLDERTARIFAVVCAEHVLHFFESACPGDMRPRQAIEAARSLIDNPNAAWSAAMSAAERARNAAMNAAWSAAWSAAECARNAAWSAAECARNAAMSAAMSAAESGRAAENKWQADKLRELIDPFDLKQE